MNFENLRELSDTEELMKILPEHAKITVTTTNNQEKYRIFINPSISEIEYYNVIFPNIRNLFAERMIYLYTEEIGRWFYVFVTKRHA